MPQEYNAKIRCFDWVIERERLMGHRSHVSTLVGATYGYAAPEYVATGNSLTPQVSMSERPNFASSRRGICCDSKSDAFFCRASICKIGHI